jgi:hypothetical protein
MGPSAFSCAGIKHRRRMALLFFSTTTRVNFIAWLSADLGYAYAASGYRSAGPAGIF